MDRLDRAVDPVYNTAVTNMRNEVLLCVFAKPLFWLMTSVDRSHQPYFFMSGGIHFMKKAFAVGIGGAIGTLFRWAVFQLPPFFGPVPHAAATLMINTTGSFLLALLVILFVRTIRVSAELRLAVTTGVMGGYTTFSTMCKDAVTLLQTGKTLTAAVYLLLTVVLGLSAAWLGASAGKRIERRMVR